MIIGTQAASASQHLFKENRETRDRLSLLLLYVPLFATTILTKIAIVPLSPDISIAVPIVVSIPLFGMILGRIRFDPLRSTLFLLVMSLLWLIQLLSDSSFSLPSMLLLTTLFLTMACYLDLPADQWERSMRTLLNLSLFLAIAGIIQFGLQFIVGTKYAFPIESFTPKSLLIQHFHYLNPLRYGGKIYKSNGVFLLEPSQFSQLLAVALIGELVTSARTWRCLVYLLGMIVAYSGTGLIVLLVCLPLLIVVQRRWKLMLLIGLTAILLLSLASTLQLDVFIHRASESHSERSSGFARFIGGFYAFQDQLWPDTDRALFGYGAGSFGEASRQFVLPAAEMPLNKIVFEFGLAGSLALFGLLFACLIRSHGPGIFRFAVGLSFFLNGLYVPTAQGIALTVMLWSGAMMASPSIGRSIATHSVRRIKPEVRHA